MADITNRIAERELSSEKTDMRREVGLFGGISVLAGIMIGSGIFYIGAIVLQRSGMSLGLALLVWLVGGLVTLLSGICYAELGAMMPKSGGVYLYLREAYGERLAFMCGFANFTLGNSGSIAALAVAFAAALSSMVPLDEWTQKSIAVGLVVLLTAVNIRGIKAGSTVQSIFLVLKMLPIVLILFAGLFMGTESPDLFAMPAETPSLMNILSMVGFAVIATLWAYEGWTNLNVIGEEIRNPKRNIPLSIIISIVGVALLYVLFNYAVYRVIPFDAIQQMVASGNYYLGTAAAEKLFGSAGMIVVGSAMVLAIFSSLNGCIMAFRDVLRHGPATGAFFKSLGHSHPPWKTPVNAILASSAVSICLILFRSLSELTSLVAVCGMIFHGMSFYAVIVLRKKYPTMERPYKVWLYPFTVLLICAIMIALIVNTVVNDPVTAALSFIVPLLGLGIYEVLFKKNRERVVAELGYD